MYAVGAPRGEEVRGDRKVFFKVLGNTLILIETMILRIPVNSKH